MQKLNLLGFIYIILLYKTYIIKFSFKMTALCNMIDRDFSKYSRPVQPNDTHTLQMINYIYKQFINFEDFVFMKQKDIIESDLRQIVLIDTCSFLKKTVTDFQNQGVRYIITCGVFLEILQGATNTTIMNKTFTKDIEKITALYTHLGSNLTFLSLGRKRRAYWNGYEPSKSCRNCVNCQNPHHKILRDVDTELYRLAILMKCSIETVDFILNKRLENHYSMSK
jgi:hypothetical protein